MPIENEIPKQETKLEDIHTKHELTQHLQDIDTRKNIMTKSNSELKNLNTSVIIDAMKDIAQKKTSLSKEEYGTIYLYARTVKNMEHVQLQGEIQQLKNILKEFRKENNIDNGVVDTEKMNNFKINTIFANINNYANWMNQLNISNTLGSMTKEEKQELTNAMDQKYETNIFLEKSAER